MTQEDKQLLLKDLCCRLPYGVIVNNPMTGDDDVLTYSLLEDFEVVNSDYPKPYLRSMSSMTEEEKEELKTLFDAEEITSDSICYLEGGTLEEYLSHISYSFCSKLIDWLNKKMFAYRTIDGKDMFELGLAIEATEGMYN